MRDEYDIERLNARKKPYAERLKKQVKELDEDTIEHVKALAEEKGVPYQALINSYLREHEENREEESLK
ncbi:MAG: antitoxin [Clostridia bacterium]|nr:antitoxin [Clostridia bacterium]